MAVAGSEIRERHFVGSADFGIQMVDLAGESVRRKPLGHCSGVNKRPINSFGCRTENAMEPDGVCGHDALAFRYVLLAQEDQFQRFLSRSPRFSA
jgi:hypothetical protein